MGSYSCPRCFSSRGGSFGCSRALTKRATAPVRSARWTRRSTWKASGVTAVRMVVVKPGACSFFKNEWLRPASGSARVGSATTDAADVEPLTSSTRRIDDSGERVYRCQATDVRQASRLLPQWDPRQYVRDLTSGNVSVGVFVRGIIVYAFKKYQLLSQRILPRRLWIRGGEPYPFYQGTGNGERTPTVELSPGEMVEIRTKAEIMPTLGPDNRNRKLWFDPEMVPHCGKRAPVNRSVRRIIDESTGKMIRLGDCIVLDNVVCQGIYHRFCPRSLDQYWRSAWLRTEDLRSSNPSV